MALFSVVFGAEADAEAVIKEIAGASVTGEPEELDEVGDPSLESNESMHVTNVISWKQRHKNADSGAGCPSRALRVFQSTHTKDAGSAVLLLIVIVNVA